VTLHPFRARPFAKLYALVAAPPMSGGKYWAKIRTFKKLDLTSPELLQARFQVLGFPEDPPLTLAEFVSFQV